MTGDGLGDPTREPDQGSREVQGASWTTRDLGGHVGIQDRSGWRSSYRRTSSKGLSRMVPQEERMGSVRRNGLPGVTDHQVRQKREKESEDRKGLTGYGNPKYLVGLRLYMTLH